MGSDQGGSFGSGGTYGGGSLRELLSTFTFAVDTKDIQQGESRLEKFLNKVQTIGAAVVGAFAVKQLYSFADGQAHVLDSLDDTANALGISTDRVQQFQFAAKSLGDDAGTLLWMMGRMQITQQAAAEGSKEAAKQFSDMGVKLKDVNGKMKTADELFLDVAEAISKQKDASKQAALAQHIFGRGGRQILPFLKEGRAGFEALAKTYKEMGGGYTKQAIDAAGKFQKEQAKLNLASTSLKNSLGIGLFPIMSKLVGWVTQGVIWFRQLAEHSSVVQAGLVLLGAAAAVAFAPFVAAGAAIAGIYVVLEDLITMFRGGESVIGTAIDRMFGKGTSTKMVKELRDLWKDIGNYIQGAWTDYKHLIDEIADGIQVMVAAWDVYRGAMSGDQKQVQRGIASYADYQNRNKAAVASDEYIPGVSPAWKAPKDSPYYRPAGMGEGPLNQVGLNAIRPEWSGNGIAKGQSLVSVGDVVVSVDRAQDMSDREYATHVGWSIRQELKKTMRRAQATLPRAPSTTQRGGTD